MDLFPLRSALLTLLSRAITDLFPTAFLGERKITRTGFSEVCYFDQPIHPHLISLLSEKIRSFIKQSPLFESIEMTPRGAFEYFNYHGQKERSLEVEAKEIEGVSMISLIRFETFLDLYSVFPYQGDWSSISFELFEAENLPKKGGKYGALISGSCFFSKEELKGFIKRRKEWLKAKPWEEGEKKGWLTHIHHRPLLLPKGVEVFRQLEKIWQLAIRDRSDFVEIKGGKRDDSFLLSQQIGKGVAEWGVVTEDLWGPKDLCCICCRASQALNLCISFLQFIRKTFSIVELNVEWILCNKKSIRASTQQWKQEVKCLTEALQKSEIAYSIDGEKSFGDHPGIELCILDSIGEGWAGPFLSVNLGFLHCEKPSSKDSKAHSIAPHSTAAIEYSLFGATKRLISLLAELKQEQLFPLFSRVLTEEK